VSRNGNPSQEIIELPNGIVIFDKTDFYSYELLAGWTYDSRNRSLFADRGARQRLSLSSTGPGSEVEFYTIRYDYTKYWPLFGPFTLKITGEVSWGEDFGSTTTLPPYKRFFGGGPDSVRGFKEGRLGPLDTNGNPFGGNLSLAHQTEILLPVPERMRGKGRLNLFFDIGNVFSTDDTRFPIINDQGEVEELDFDFDASELRYSAGIAAEWLSPMGVFRFSYGVPLNDESDDEVEEFQFSIGSAF
jgi:outer membrane protein insertion porin family